MPHEDWNPSIGGDSNKKSSGCCCNQHTRSIQITVCYNVLPLAWPFSPILEWLIRLATEKRRDIQQFFFGIGRTRTVFALDST